MFLTRMLTIFPLIILFIHFCVRYMHANELFHSNAGDERGKWRRGWGGFWGNSQAYRAIGSNSCVDTRMRSAYHSISLYINRAS